ncbi:20623_t:CDS:1 [Funneliformis geosporum]|uniref:11857_t:CDS:1 n=1 Tax=Funneliformis geosporum TaxID=1117311 RepID=A0A9W4X0N2_9GLOM|nr:11857_t:CDS:1 [Funneliformis geosporum]CAI2182823.1 20623_t:CDS:1 [Funneliformis geosporum]
MKIKHYYLIFSLLLAVSTNCALIPNTKVVTYPESNEECALVEGITYNIVHVPSNINLDSDGKKVEISSPEHNSKDNPFQYWILRKANNVMYPIDFVVYNIIHAQTGLNLDSDNKIIGISSPKHNSVSNAYQHWLIIKNGINAYNIAHMMSGLMNLDSNGKKILEISPPEHNSRYNLYQQWSFIPRNFKLTVNITDFIYPADLTYNLEKYKTRTSLFAGNYVIQNPTKAVVEQTIDKTETKSNNYTVEIKRTQSVTVNEQDTITVNIGAILNKLNINTSYQKGITHSVTKSFEESYKDSIYEEVSYHIQHKVTVPPQTSITVDATVDKVNMQIPFTAKIRITAQADRMDENGKLVPMVDVDTNSFACYLKQENYDATDAIVEGNALVVNTSGILSIDAYGLDSRIITKEMKQ